jgi:hypothetical protein
VCCICKLALHLSLLRWRRRRAEQIAELPFRGVLGSRGRRPREIPILALWLPLLCTFPHNIQAPPMSRVRRQAAV